MFRNSTYPALLLAAIAAFCQPVCAQPSSLNPALPAINYYPELMDGVGKWHIHAPTLLGWHYSLEQLDTTDGRWKPLADGQYYGNGQPIKYYVTDGPMPSTNTAGPPPTGVPTWQFRFITFRLEMRKNALSPTFRIRRDATFYAAPGEPIAVAAWDSTVTGQMPAQSVGSRYYLFQSWDDPVAKIMWQTECVVTVTDDAPPDENLPSTPEQTGELNVFDQIKDQLIGAMTSPFIPSQPSPPGPKRLIRLRRTPIDTNGNGLPNWFEEAFDFNPFVNNWLQTTSDYDGDGLTKIKEMAAGTNPRLADTDGDGATDSYEVRSGTDPLNPENYPPLFRSIALSLWQLSAPTGDPLHRYRLTSEWIPEPNSTVELPMSGLPDFPTLSTLLAQTPGLPDDPPSGIPRLMLPPSFEAAATKHLNWSLTFPGQQVTNIRQRIWMEQKPAPTQSVSRTFLKRVRTTISDVSPELTDHTAYTPITFTIPGDGIQLHSPPQDFIPDFREMDAPEINIEKTQLVTADLIPIEVTVKRHGGGITPVEGLVVQINHNVTFTLSPLLDDAPI